MTSLPALTLRRKTVARRLAAAVRATAPWLLSLVIHALAMVAFGLWAAPAATGSLGQRPVIELTCILGEEPTAAFTLSRVPELIDATAAHQPARAPAPAPPATQPTFSVQPATYAQPIAAQPIAAQPASEPQPTLTQVFGVFARGTRFVYVFDRSASMEGRPLEAAKRELVASLADLAPRDRFQVVFYSDQPRLMSLGRTSSRGLLVADEFTKRLAGRYIGGVLAEGSTNHLAALAAALELQSDVIFFLTDSAGEQMTADQLARVRQLNRATAIFTIEFGAGGRASTPSFLERLAMENGGQHTYIDVTRLR